MDFSKLPAILTPDLGLLFWMLLAFAVVFFVLAKYGFPAIVGMVDERNKFIEDSEELEIVLADRDEVRRILKEEKVAIMCAYQLMHFLVDKEPFAFLGV